MKTNANPKHKTTTLFYGSSFIEAAYSLVNIVAQVSVYQAYNDCIGITRLAEPVLPEGAESLKRVK